MRISLLLEEQYTFGKPDLCIKMRITKQFVKFNSFTNQKIRKK